MKESAFDFDIRYFRQRRICLWHDSIRYSAVRLARLRRPEK